MSSGVELAITPLPIGGYVKLFDEREAPLTQQQKPFDINRQSTYKKTFIYLAGPINNLLLAIFLFFMLFWLGTSFFSPTVGKVIPHSIAAQGGVQAEDQFISIDGWSTHNWSLALMALLAHSGDKTPLLLEVKKKSGVLKLIKLDVTDWRFDGIKSKPLASLGIILPIPLEKKVINLNFLQAGITGFKTTWQYIALNSLIIHKLFTGKISIAALTGPLLFFDSAQRMFQLGIDRFLYFIALLSIAVGVVNLLPLPGLDGGHILFALIEKWRGVPVSIAVQVLLYRFMMAAFFIFFMHLIANDLRRLAHTPNEQPLRQSPLDELQAQATMESKVKSHNLRAKSHQ